MKIFIPIVTFMLISLVIVSCKKSSSGSVGIQPKIMQNTWYIHSMNVNADNNVSSSEGGLIYGTVTYKSNGQEIRYSPYGPMYTGGFTSSPVGNPDTGYYAVFGNKLIEKFPFYNADFSAIDTLSDTLTINHMSATLLILSQIWQDPQSNYSEIDSLTTGLP
jgi:hypothetical protein